MVASQAFFSILEQIQNSKLNFQLHLSPFSANISLKKSLITDKNGNPIMPLCSATTSNTSYLDLELQNNLKSDNVCLQKENKEQDSKIKSFKDTIKILEQKLSKAEASVLKVFEERNIEEATLKKSLKNVNSELENMKKDLQSKNRFIKEKEKEVTKLELKCDNLGDSLERCKSEVKYLKSENSKLAKIQKKVQLKKSKNVSTNTTVLEEVPISTIPLSAIMSSVTTPPIIGMDSYSPDMSELSVTDIPTPNLDELNNIFTIEPEEPPVSVVSPAASCSPSTPARWTPSSNQSEVCANPNYSGVCSHSPQCISRQPLPPPPEKCSILNHLGSKYHVHMVNETSGVPARYGPHEYCMRIEYENYGCEDCIWFKWWGELHGYPDISPWSYREHLQPVNNF